MAKRWKRLTKRQLKKKLKGKQPAPTTATQSQANHRPAPSSPSPGPKLSKTGKQKVLHRPGPSSPSPVPSSPSSVSTNLYLQEMNCGFFREGLGWDAPEDDGDASAATVKAMDGRSDHERRADLERSLQSLQGASPRLTLALEHGLGARICAWSQSLGLHPAVDSVLVPLEQQGGKSCRARARADAGKKTAAAPQLALEHMAWDGNGWPQLKVTLEHGPGVCRCACSWSLGRGAEELAQAVSTWEEEQRTLPKQCGRCNKVRMPHFARVGPDLTRRGLEKVSLEILRRQRQRWEERKRLQEFKEARRLLPEYIQRWEEKHGRELSFADLHREAKRDSSEPICVLGRAVEKKLQELAQDLLGQGVDLD